MEQVLEQFETELDKHTQPNSIVISLIKCIIYFYKWYINKKHPPNTRHPLWVDNPPPYNTIRVERVKALGLPLYSENCSICFEEFGIEKFAYTKCSHGFCTGCIDKWLKTKGDCPCCRRILKIVV